VTTVLNETAASRWGSRSILLRIPSETDTESVWSRQSKVKETDLRTTENSSHDCFSFLQIFSREDPKIFKHQYAPICQSLETELNDSNCLVATIDCGACPSPYTHKLLKDERVRFSHMLSTSYVTRMNALCHAREWFKSRLFINHVTHPMKRLPLPLSPKLPYTCCNARQCVC